MSVQGPPKMANTSPLLYGSMSSGPGVGESSASGASAPYKSLSDSAHELAVDPSVLNHVPQDSKLFALDVADTFGNPFAKNWAWITRDQFAVGLVRYPFYGGLICRFFSFLLRVFCLGCLCSGKKDKDSEEVAVKSESSFLIFTSRVDYLTIHAFRSSAELLRFRLPFFSTYHKVPGAIGALISFGFTVLGIFWRIFTLILEWVWCSEFGIVLFMWLMTIATLAHSAPAAGLNGDPDYFAGGCAIACFVFFLWICAIVWHCANKNEWKNASNPTPAQKKQLDRWGKVTCFYILIFIFLVIALIAAAVFVHAQYYRAHIKTDWEAHDRLMCYPWDDSQGVVKPYVTPVPPPPYVAPVYIAPLAPTLVRTVADTISISVLFTPPDFINYQEYTYNGTAVANDGSTSTFTTTIGPSTGSFPTTTAVTVGLNFVALKPTTRYKLYISTQWNGVYSLNTLQAEMDTAPMCENVNSCTAPPVAPTILSVVPGLPGDNMGYVTVIAPPTSNTPTIEYYTIYQVIGGQYTVLMAVADITSPIPIDINGQWGSYLGFVAVATNQVGNSPYPVNPTYQIFQAPPTGIKNMCSKVQRSTFITFLFAMSVVFLLLIIQMYLTYIRFQQLTYARLTLHGKTDWGLPVSVLLSVNDAREIETIFTGISKGNYALATNSQAYSMRDIRS